MPVSFRVWTAPAALKKAASLVGSFQGIYASISD
jgi:hypothetical protein